VIVRKRPRGWQLFFIVRGSILYSIRWSLLVNTLLAIAVTYVHGNLFKVKITLTTIPFTLIGLALAIFLGFRNSATYDRYWEGRKLWGELVIQTRVLCRQILAYANPTDFRHSGTHQDPEQDTQVRRLIAFSHALRHHLRDTDPQPDITPHLSDEDLSRCLKAQHRPESLLHQMARQFDQWQQDGRLREITAMELDKGLSALQRVVGACERIKHTPLPFSYTLMLHRTAYLYCLLLPFGLVDTIGFMTPVVVAIVSYTFFGLDALGDEIEEPFGMSPNDLPLSAICRSVERLLREQLGDDDLPPPLEPDNHCLS